jgi:hypothetical protein
MEARIYWRFRAPCFVPIFEARPANDNSRMCGYENRRGILLHESTQTLSIRIPTLSSWPCATSTHGPRISTKAIDR